MFYLTAKFQKIVMNGYRETAWRTNGRTNVIPYVSFRLNAERQKMLKTPIFGRFRPKRPILDNFWPKRGHFRIFGEKAKTSLFYSVFFIFQYKKSENSNVRIFGKMGTYERTNKRTNGGESKGPSTPSKDQKISWKITKMIKWGRLDFLHFSQKRLEFLNYKVAQKEYWKCTTSHRKINGLY